VDFNGFRLIGTYGESGYPFSNSDQGFYRFGFVGCNLYSLLKIFSLQKISVVNCDRVEVATQIGPKPGSTQKNIIESSISYKINFYD
jgi:hypothetical protein